MSLSVTSRAASLCALLALAALVAPAARADDAADVSKLIHEHQLDEALQKVDSVLSAKPRDAQMRFFKGLILSEQGRTNDAIGVFLRLTEDYPELPEPYNNLAVLYASQGDYEKARASLEMAIRTHPSYATAHENLGDVYAKLASQAYDKALALDSTNTTAQTKLALIHELISANPGAVKRPAGVSAPAAPAAPSVPPHASVPVPVVVAGAAPAPQSTPGKAPAAALAVSSPTATATSTPPSSAATSAQPAPNANAVKPTPPAATPATSVAAKAPEPAPAANASQAEVTSAVEAWAKAWSGKAVDTYLAAYAKDFATPGGQSRHQWEDERRDRIVGKSSINVTLENLEVSVEGDKAVAHFRQEYHADKLSTNSRKTLNLVKENGRWLILKESSGA